MSTDAMTRPTYGNWRRPRRPGLGPLGLLGTVVAFGGLLVALLASLVSLAAAIVVLVPVGLFLAPLALRTVDGRNVYQVLALRIGWMKRKSSGSHTYVSGPLSKRPGGRFQPPGLLARTKMYEGRDAYNRTFGVLHHPGRGLYTVVLACEPDGGSLVDPEQVDIWVASWGDWLARLSHEPGLRGAQVVVETAPDTGTRLASEVLPRIAPDAPAAARAVMEEVVARYPSASSEMHTYIALTYGPTGGPKRNVDDIITDLSMRLPGLLSGLVAAGGGSAYPLAADRLAEIVRVAYDPAIAPDVLSARAEHATTGLEWDDSKPRGRRRDRHLVQARLGCLAHLDADARAARHGPLQRSARPARTRVGHPAQAGLPHLPPHRPGDLRPHRGVRPPYRALHGGLAARSRPGAGQFGDAGRRADGGRGGGGRRARGVLPHGDGHRRRRGAAAGRGHRRAQPPGVVPHPDAPRGPDAGLGLHLHAAGRPAAVGAHPRSVPDQGGAVSASKSAMSVPPMPSVPPRGWYGPGGGQVGHLDPPSMWRATTVQACGLWPFAAGSGAPMTGVPLGQHLHTGATVCGDPISWFTRARYISNPSLFMLGMPGLGKSTLVNRMLIGMAATGITPLVLGDLKPDYADTVRALGGQVISIGRGVGGINVLDPGAMGEAAVRIGASGAASSRRRPTAAS